jgi:hypothetical protein
MNLTRHSTRGTVRTHISNFAGSFLLSVSSCELYVHLPWTPFGAMNGRSVKMFNKPGPANFGRQCSSVIVANLPMRSCISQHPGSLNCPSRDVPRRVNGLEELR